VTAADRLRRVADAALEATVVGSFSRLGFGARRALFGWDAEPPVDLTGRVALVTGATGGIGVATAHALATRHADVWILGRDATRTEHARQAILASTPGARVTAAVADLADFDDVRRLADAVLHDTARLDVLVHNAGALVHDLRYTSDGIEVTAQVHVVAPVLLTSLLLEHLRATAGSRVITVSSGGMYTTRLDVEGLAKPPLPFDGVRVYANAKRAQVVVNELWTRRPEAAGVTFHAMHPGWADTPGIRAALPRFHAVMRPLLRTPAQGADTIAWLAGAPEARETNGGFWLDRRRRATEPLPGTHTPDQSAQQLWAWCTERAGVELPRASTP
jgi:NAD(P)-dependent dehydrogenase (short-subunit alcohol dehydrogenase family)